jgi:hypothetical protein
VIGVERIQRAGMADSYEVVARVDHGAAVEIPAIVIVRRGSRRIQVPVRVAESEQYQLE